MIEDENHYQLENKGLKIALEKLCAENLWEAVENSLKRARRESRWWDDTNDDYDDNNAVTRRSV